MTLSVKFVHETPLARLYQRKDGSSMWIPKSVTRSVVKFEPPSPLDHAVHHVEVEDWWYDKQFPDGGDSVDD